MNGILATLTRELRAYFFSPLAYVILTFFLLINGYIFSLIVSILNDPRAGGSTTPLKLFFGDTIFFWLVLLFITPILTMRLLAEEGMTMICVTHEMGFARDVSDRVAYFHEGVMEEVGPPAQIFGDARSEHTAKFLAKVR